MNKKRESKERYIEKVNDEKKEGEICPSIFFPHKCCGESFLLRFFNEQRVIGYRKDLSRILRSLIRMPDQRSAVNIFLYLCSPHFIILY